MMAPQDEAFFLERAGRRLFAIWQGTEAAPIGAALFCHPFGEEKKSSHRAFVVTARALAARGIASLRFDMSGCGDSDGEFSEAGLKDWIADVERAWRELRRRAGECRNVVVGLRLGAAIAAAALPKLEKCDALALWQPVIEGRAEFGAELRRLLVQQMMTRGKAGTGHKELLASLEKGEGEVELDGYPVTGVLYRDICGMSLPKLLGTFPSASGIVQFARRDRRIAAFAESAKIPTAVIDTPPIWTRTDFLPSAADGEVLAREGVMRWAK